MLNICLIDSMYWACFRGCDVPSSENGMKKGILRIKEPHALHNWTWFSFLSPVRPIERIPTGPPQVLRNQITLFLVTFDSFSSHMYILHYFVFRGPHLSNMTLRRQVSAAVHDPVLKRILEQVVRFTLPELARDVVRWRSLGLSWKD